VGIKTNNINNLRFDSNGIGFFLHYSPADIKVGESILPSGSPGLTQRGQTGDALFGRSYAFDALDPESLHNSVLNQGLQIRPGEKRVYLTSADSSLVGPDVNVSPGNFRAIKGKQEVIDFVDIPLVTDVEAQAAEYNRGKSLVQEMLERHGIIPNTKEDQKLVNIAHYISDRAVEDISEYPGMRIRATINEMIERKSHETAYTKRSMEKNPETKPFWKAIEKRDPELAYELRHMSNIRRFINPEIESEGAKLNAGLLETIKEAGVEPGRKASSYSRKELSSLVGVVEKHFKPTRSGYSFVLDNVTDDLDEVPSASAHTVGRGKRLFSKSMRKASQAASEAVLDGASGSGKLRGIGLLGNLFRGRF